jgi:hypothetical protein
MKKLSILVVAGMLCLMALPAFAQDKADWAFYGSVRMWTSWEDWDQDAPNVNFGAPGTKRSGSYAVGTSKFDDSDLWWGMQYNARIGANVKWGNVGGRFEYGHLNTEGSGTGADTAHVRLLYGDWNFGPGVLRIGQDYTPYFYTISQQCGPSGGDCSGIGFGSLYSGRQDQIKLIFGGFQVALIEPKVVTTGLSATATNDQDRIFPKIEASYNFNLGPANFMIAGGYNTYDAVYVVGGAEKEISVDSWGLGIGAKVPIGPFYANAAFQYLVNPGNYGFGQNAPLLLTTLTGDSNPANQSSTEDLSVWTGALALGFNLTSTMNFEAGVFMVDATTKTTAALGTAGPFGVDADVTLWAYYLMMNWSPAKNVFISPEIGLVDFGKVKVDGQSDDDLGDMFYVGIKWMINF